MFSTFQVEIVIPESDLLMLVCCPVLVLCSCMLYTSNMHFGLYVYTGVRFELMHGNMSCYCQTSVFVYCGLYCVTLSWNPSVVLLILELVACSFNFRVSLGEER